jgi:uncharacterized protein (DUF488 family)
MNDQSRAVNSGTVIRESPTKMNIFSIGHSTHPIEQFLGLLAEQDIESLADIRRFPSSRKFPQFNQDQLASAVQLAGIEYHWLEALGGRRSETQGESRTANLGLRNASFRNYADYMLTSDFEEGIARLLEIARRKRTALMCAEGLFWRCHRRLVSDFLLAKGITVQHIFPDGSVQPHQLTEGAIIDGGRVTYPGEKSLFS